jgi:polysaccharide deacetylase 2 family uncharacterized protein YibQ
VQARYGLLMESTSQFQGDFADTSDGLANSQRVLKARLTDLSAELGENLVPHMETATAGALVLVAALEKLKDVASIPTKPFDNSETTRELSEALRENMRTEEERAKIVEEANRRIGAAYVQNARGIKAWQDQVAADDHV